jgi:hypothetical protein
MSSERPDQSTHKSADHATDMTFGSQINSTASFSSFPRSGPTMFLLGARTMNGQDQKEEIDRAIADEVSRNFDDLRPSLSGRGSHLSSGLEDWLAESDKNTRAIHESGLRDRLQEGVDFRKTFQDHMLVVKEKVEGSNAQPTAAARELLARMQELEKLLDSANTSWETYVAAHRAYRDASTRLQDEEALGQQDPPEEELARGRPPAHCSPNPLLRLF